jgi:hypothetical protein
MPEGEDGVVVVSELGDLGGVLLEHLATTGGVERAAVGTEVPPAMDDA